MTCCTGVAAREGRVVWGFDMGGGVSLRVFRRDCSLRGVMATEASICFVSSWHRGQNCLILGAV